MGLRYAHHGRSKASITKADIAAVKVVVKQHVSFLVKDIAVRTGIWELPYKFCVLGQIGLSKQCRPRSDCF